MIRNEFYHIYNRGNNKENIFFSDRNYRYFLTLFQKYLADYVKLYAYCLMPNHFHFFIRIREMSNLDETDLEQKVSRQFRLFFMSYSKAINNERGRTGSLFQKNFKSKLVDNEDYFTSLIAYIHLNPVKSKLCLSCEQWKYSSYSTILSLKDTFLARHEVIEWFNGMKEFKKFHDECLELNIIE